MILNLASRMPFYQKYFDKDFEKNLFSVKRSVGVQPCCGWEGIVSSAFWALTVCLYELFSLIHVQTYLYTLCNIAERLFFA